MASFADKIPTFNPYVQQLPVEEMAKVGMQKQQQYNEGIQKIQTNIDNIAGLDIYRNLDKTYLQSKLNQLGNNLTTVAAGDFSNFQLVNSVNGMTNQITKDPNIVNAVSSTATIRKGIADMEAARKTGKSSVNREYDYNKMIQDYSSNNDLKASFNGRFTEHTDVNKKVLEVIKSLNPNSTDQDFAFAKNNDGSFNYSKYADIMHRKGITGLDEGQIKTAVNAMLDDNDKDELASQGRYSYKDSDVNALQNHAKEGYRNSKEQATEQLNYLQSTLLTTTDPEQQKLLNKSISYYTNLLGDPKTNTSGQLDTQLANTLSSIQSNPDGARAAIYTNNWLTQIGNGFTYKKVNDQVLANPGREDEWKQINYNFDKAKQAYVEKHGWAELDISQKNLDLAKDKLSWEKSGKPIIPNGPESGPYLKTTGNKAIDDMTALANWASDNTQTVNDNQGIMNELIKNTSSANKKSNATVILQNMEAYKNGKYTPATMNQKRLFDQYINNTNTLAQNKAIYDLKYKEAYSQVTGGKTEQEVLGIELSKIPKLNVSVSGGITSFSPKEVYDYLLKEKNPVKYISGAPSYSTLGMPIHGAPDDENLTPREKLLKHSLGNRYTENATSSTSVLGKYLNNFNPIVYSQKDIREKVNHTLATNLAPLTGEYATKQAAITFNKTEDKKNFAADLVNVAQADLASKSAGKNYNPATVLSMIDNDKILNTSNFQFVRQGEKNYVQVVNSSDPSNNQLIPVDANFVVKNSHLGEQFLAKNLSLAKTILHNNGSTNLFKDYDHAAYPAGQIGTYNVHGQKSMTLPIAADLNYEGGSYYVTFKMKNPDGSFISKPYLNAIDYDTFVSSFLPSMTNEKVLKLFNIKN